ncbi:putative polysaccharide biosynthesis protein [Vallitalea okinawensis]|uniref:putative polysaccharide biosynthesis protein n=1 Tax=Vallitalea okinawensis TaxID=2078660 RepID=UPI000CFDC682|nr:polysaccharide biosynthesis protein [Vallitalea okinawensis]
MRRNSLIGGAIILTIAGFITRILGFVYRVYISNLIGSEGMGLFQLIFPVYLLCHTVCASGSFIAISKIIAEENAKRQHGNMRKALKIGATLSLVASIAVSGCLFIGADFIGTTLLSDERTVIALRVLSFTIPFSVLNSCFKAYFYGTKEMHVPATSQVIEQVSRMGIIYLISGLFIPKGLTYACIMAVIGTGVGEVVSFSHVYLSYKHHTRKKKLKHYQIHPSLSTGALLSSMFAVIIPLTSSRTITTLLMSYENIIIPTKLEAFGLTSGAAMSLYGELTGMALPLIMFPSLLTNALSMSLLPTISEASAVKNSKKICITISKALQFTAIIGIGSTCLFMTFPHELGITFYNQPNVGTLLSLLAFMCPFIYIQSTFGGILNGLGLQKVAFINNLVGTSIRISFIVFLVPKYGINAVLIGFTLSFIIVSSLNIRKVLRVAVVNFQAINWLLKPTLAALAAGLTSNYVAKHYIYPYYSMTVSLILGIGILCLIYIAFILLLGCIKKEDIDIVKHSL